MADERRHLRQISLPWCGPAGQERLRGGHAMIAGCGALGCAAIEWLARAGVGQLTLVDRDVVEWSNLQRQSLFDARERAPKAEAAARRVREIDSSIRVHACVEHIDAQNAAELARGVGVIVDGLDNIETRFLLNDLAVRGGVPYVHAAAVAMEGRALAVLPQDIGRAGEPGHAPRGACLRCVYPELPAPGALPTCEHAGVLGPLVGMVGAFAASQAIFILAGRADLLERRLCAIDLTGRRVAAVDASIDPQCDCCGRRRFEFLEAAAAPRAARLCGRNSVQVLPARRRDDATDLAALQERLRSHGNFAMRGRELVGALRDVPGADGEPVELTIFADGRAIVGHCDDEALARSIYDRFIGA
jgi:adenylyltransferase/sulfurtransferase